MTVQLKFLIRKRLKEWFAPLDLPMNKVKNSYAENKLYRIYNVLKEQLKYVYISNLFKDEFMKFRDTTCPKCGEILISRRGKTEINRLSCCGEKVAGILL